MASLGGGEQLRAQLLTILQDVAESEGGDRPMTTAELLVRVAETDQSFALQGPNWVGKCLICNGPIAFDAKTGEGATVEHIRARSRGGGGSFVCATSPCAATWRPACDAAYG